jgi:hypothetical protein
VIHVEYVTICHFTLIAALRSSGDGGAVISGVGGGERVDGSNAVEMSDERAGVCVKGDGDIEVVGGVGVGLAKDSEKSVSSERRM